MPLGERRGANALGRTSWDTCLFSTTMVRQISEGRIGAIPKAAFMW
jgi:hypothetical protein